MKDVRFALGVTVGMFMLAGACLSAGVFCGEGPGDGRPARGYRGGSPFPPGKEPSLTHTAKVFWTTRGDVDRTEVEVVTKGSRPSQSDCTLFKDGKQQGCPACGASIAPGSNFKICFVRAAAEFKRAGWRVAKVDGSGNFVLKTHGWKLADYANPPLITVRYYAGGKLVGETSVATAPVPEKIKKEAKASSAK